MTDKEIIELISYIVKLKQQLRRKDFVINTLHHYIEDLKSQKKENKECKNNGDGN